MTQGHARSDPIHAEKAQADPRERLAQQQPHRAGAVRPAPPRDVPSSAVAGDTTVRKYYANFPAVDKSDHPAYRPPLPRRPPVPPREGPSNVAGTIAANPPISHPNSSSSIHTSKASVTSSACISEASTPATSTLPEPVVPRNARQEPLRQFAWLGFSVDAPLDLSDLAKAQQRTVTTGWRERHSHFRLPNGNHGIISPRAREVHCEGNTVVFPRNSTVSTILKFERRQRPNKARFPADTILRRLLLSEEVPYEDVPDVLRCFYWMRSHDREGFLQIPPVLRMSCNARQRRVMLSFDRLSSVKDPTDLARGLIGRDPYDDSLRVCAFLELSADRDGPFGILNLLNRIQKGRKAMGYGPPKFDHLVRAAPESISELVGTIVHSLGQRLARAGCSARDMQDVADAISLILALSGDRDMGQVLFRVLPKLRRGEITLSFSLLLATGLATDESCAEMWDLFSHALARPPSRPRVRQSQLSWPSSSSCIPAERVPKLCFPGFGGN
ncbi:hypothetical protein LTR12_015598 [Friedmanniomyces endolithicus]|nr:hypothetical protein LTR12_015598 [Friedmanniomyces endolithicus]